MKKKTTIGLKKWIRLHFVQKLLLLDDITCNEIAFISWLSIFNLRVSAHNFPRVYYEAVLYLSTLEAECHYSFYPRVPDILKFTMIPEHFHLFIEKGARIYIYLFSCLAPCLQLVYTRDISWSGKYSLHVLSSRAPRLF